MGVRKAVAGLCHGCKDTERDGGALRGVGESFEEHGGGGEDWRSLKRTGMSIEGYRHRYRDV